MKVSLQYQKIEKLLQKVNEQVEEFFSSPYKNERTISFLNGKAIAYRNVLDVLSAEKEEE